MATFNWTIEDVGHLLATYPGFRYLNFKYRNVSIQHVQQLGNITNEIYGTMLRDVCANSFLRPKFRSSFNI
uniref:Uncharacterized protein n=1 Tax=Romanomermis culicivorax TaxID=13658 RepID=A0A915JPQ9_ROMCU